MPTHGPRGNPHKTRGVSGAAKVVKKTLKRRGSNFGKAVSRRAKSKRK